MEGGGSTLRGTVCKAGTGPEGACLLATCLLPPPSCMRAPSFRCPLPLAGAWAAWTRSACYASTTRTAAAPSTFRQSELQFCGAGLGWSCLRHPQPDLAMVATAKAATASPAQQVFSCLPLLCATGSRLSPASPPHLRHLHPSLILPLHPCPGAPRLPLPTGTWSTTC